MSEEKKEQIRVTAEQAFHHIGAALENHSERLDNVLETITAQATLIDCLIVDVKALRTRLDNQAKEIETLREMVLPQQVN